MRIGDLFGMSLSSLFKRKIRTVLTVLGVVIGTTSIVVMISLGIGMKQSMLSGMESWSNLTAIEVQSGGNDMGGSDESSKNDSTDMYLSDEKIALFESLDHVESADPQLSYSAIIRCNGYIGWVDIIGVTPGWLESQKIEVAEGHLPLASDKLELLYGNVVLQRFQNEKTNKGYWDTGELPPIDYMKDTLFAIFDTDGYFQAGTTDENGQIRPMPKRYIMDTAGVVAGGPEDWNQFSYNVYCNIDALKDELKRVYKKKAIPGQPTRKNGKPYNEIFYNTIIVNVDDMANVMDVQKQINEMGFQTYTSAEWIESNMQQMNLIQGVLGGIGAVSLLVAAIGITNTMMMSIYERTKEIGIMKVIGCRIRDIQALFLVEAGFIGLIGGVLGVGLSYLLSMVVNKLTAGGEDILGFGATDASLSVIPLWLSGAAIVFSILIAVLAGFFPSLRAMKLSPLAAIRAE